MHTDDFEHLTHRERREILRWRAWDAKIALDQAVRIPAQGCSQLPHGRSRDSERLDGFAPSARHRIESQAKLRQRSCGLQQLLAENSTCPRCLRILPDKPFAFDSRGCPIPTGSAQYAPGHSAALPPLNDRKPKPHLTNAARILSR